MGASCQFFNTFAKTNPGDFITPEALAAVLIHPGGGLKNIPPGTRRIALLNQAEGLLQQSTGQKLARQLLPKYNAIVITSMESQDADSGLVRDIPILFMLFMSR